MAVWQFKIVLIPKQWLDSGGDVAALFEADGYEDSSAWADYSNSLLEQRLGSLLPPCKSWYPELTCWGSEAADDVQLWREHGKVLSLAIRFDLRSPNIALFEAVASAARDLELSVLVLGNRRVIAADLQSLLRAATESDALRFTADSHSFLLQLDAENAKST